MSPTKVKASTAVAALASLARPPTTGAAGADAAVVGEAVSSWILRWCAQTIAL